MKVAAVVFSILTILSLNLILLLGAVVRDPESIRSFLNGLVVVLDSSLVSSSASARSSLLEKRLEVARGVVLPQHRDHRGGDRPQGSGVRISDLGLVPCRHLLAESLFDMSDQELQDVAQSKFMIHLHSSFPANR